MEISERKDVGSHFLFTMGVFSSPILVATAFTIVILFLEAVDT